MSKESSASGGVGCLTVVLIVFLVLKLAGVEPVASWSWWWVTAPMWIPLALVLLVAFLIFATLGLIGLIVQSAERQLKDK